MFRDDLFERELLPLRLSGGGWRTFAAALRRLRRCLQLCLMNSFVIQIQPELAVEQVANPILERTPGPLDPTLSLG